MAAILSFLISPTQVENRVQDNSDHPDHNGTANDPTILSDCWEKDTIPVCNDNVQISLNENGEAIIIADFLLEGSNPDCNDFFEITVMNPHGMSQGDRVTCADIGKTLTVKAKHVVSCNECWGTVIIEDKLPPTLTCGDPVLITCDMDLDDLPKPQSIDNV